MSSDARKQVGEPAFAAEGEVERERTRPRVPRADIHPGWLKQGQWVLIRRNGRFARVVGEHQHSPRTVFEVLICADGTRYLIPLDEVLRVLRPVADPETAERMRDILLGRHSDVGSTLSALRQALSSQNWANHLPEAAAAIVQGCYRHDILRRDECAQSFRRLEELVLTELSLSLEADMNALQREVYEANGLASGQS